MNQITSSGYSPSTLSKFPVIRTFQIDGGGIGNIPNAVNLFRGDVNLPLELISLPGRSDLDVQVAIMYRSNIQNLVDTWNLEAPTGILGLGWDMPYEMIAIDNKSTGSGYDNEYYIVSGGGASRLYQDGVNLAKDGVSIESLNFETEDYKPWDIRYYPQDETWVIVKENGVKQIYGGKEGNFPQDNPYIQWGVKWGKGNGNWIDSSTNISGQEPIALAWNLAEIRNTWGEKVTFNYEVDLEEIGTDGYQYTKACYLKRITAIDGRTVSFVYKSKQYDNQIREYQIPHEYTGQSNLYAYQDRYETKFLDSIEVRQEESESLLFYFQFDYELENVSLIDFNNADFYKRYLIGITQKNVDGESLPGYKFEYYTKDIDENIHRGGLKNITYPAGGIANFTYDKKDLVGTSHQTKIFGVGIPRVWFGSDYVVVTYYDESRQNLDIKLYSWNGNWISYQPSAGGFNFKLDIDSLQVIAQRDFFALSFKTNSEMRVYLFHQEMGRFGQWSYENYSLDLPSSDAQTNLAVGSDFVVAAVSGGNTKLWVWNQQSKIWNDRSSRISISKGNYSLAALGNYFTIGIYDAASKSCGLVLYYQDEIYQQWTRKDIGNISLVEQDETGNPYFDWSLSNNSATATFIKSFGTNIDYEVRIYQWDAKFKVASPLSNSYSLPQDTEEPFFYSLTTGSLVANVEHIWRYNGSIWQEDNLRVGNGATKFAYGSDLAIASSSSSSEIKAYDPYRDRWTNAEIQGSWSKDEYQPTISGDFVTIGNGIFHRNNQGQLNKDRRSIPSGINPDSIINRAPFYIACETNSGESQIFLLKNDKVVDTEFLAERIYVDNESSEGRSGTILAGFNAFVTYRGDNFDQASNLNLYYIADKSIKDRVVDFPVIQVTINDGYQESQTSYDYDTGKVVISSQSIVTEYPHITVIQGSENPRLTPFGKTEYFFFNGLSAASLGFEDFKGIPPYYYSLLHGSLYQQKAYSSTGEELTRQTVEYDIVTERQKLEEPASVNLYGFYLQQKREESILYCQEISSIDSKVNASNVGIKREVEYEYDSATGLLKTQKTKNYNSLGEEEILTQTSIYGWEKYDELRQQNILTPVVQDVRKTNDKTTAIATSTWKDWGEGKWGLYRSYQGLNESAVFEQWDNQTEPNITDWLKASEVVSRSSKGVAQDSIDVKGIHSSVILDKQQLYPVAQFSNATVEEATYTGFEACENLSDWTVSQGDINDFIVKGDAHTGFASLQLKPNLTLKKQTALTITNTQQSYIISAWFKTETGFETDGGKAEVKLQFYNGNNSVGNPITASIKSTDSKWKYWHYAISSEQIQGTNLGLEISNQKTSKSLLIDDICFIPLMGSFQGNVYETRDKTVSAQLGNSGDTVRYLYDSFQRKVAEIGLSETVSGVTTNYLTRQGNDEANYVFSQDEPNSSLSIGAAEGGVYANFANGEQWREDWEPTSNSSLAENSRGDNWQAENNALLHRGNTLDSITYQATASFSNYGVRLSIHPQKPLQQPLGVRIGDQLTVTWTQNQGWTLTLKGSSSQIANTGAIPHEWLLIAVNNTVLFYADGQQIFAQTVENNITGALELFTADEVAFANILTFKNPQIGITYSDGAGKERQTQALEEGNCLVTETVYDDLNREAIATKTVRFNNTLFGYRQTFVENINWESGVLTGEVANYYPDDEGYPYSRIVYEASPLNRPIQQGIPGKAFAIGNGNTHIVTSEYGTNLQGFFAEDSYPSGQYLVEKLTDADGTPVYTLKDQLGQTLAKKSGPIEAGGDVYQTTRNIYDDAGNVVKVLLPNQFFPPTGSQPDAWEITMDYDFLGQMTSQTNPDSGTTKYIYDPSGQPRFMVDAVGLASSTILYKKYDAIGRLIEEGWFSGDWGDGSTLQQKADTDPNYPQQNSWRKRYIFDGDGSNPYLIGRLWKVLSSNQGDGNSDVEEAYSYDELGNVASKTLTVTGYAAQTVHYEYDNLGNVIKIHYPDSSNNIPEVVYSYNSLGEPIAIGTPQNPQRFATYTYNADGSLDRTTLNNGGIQNSLEYNSPGWPTRIGNEKADNSLVMEQSLAYRKDGYEGSGYYNGNIAKNSINYGIWENAPQSYDYKYQYDKLRRLEIAQNSQNEQASLGIGQPTTYDLNGNIETLKRGDSTNEYKYIENTNQVNGVSNGSQPQSYSYDANGNVKTVSHRQISQIDYDPLTQLTTKVELEGETSVSFKYDGGNQRVLKTSQDSSGKQTASKLYLHGLNDYPLLEVSDQTLQYIYGIGGLVALVKDGEVYTVLKDHLGSTRVVVDEAGTVITAFDYLPFGDLMGTAYGNPEIISYRYTGQEFDAELGLYNYRARIYDHRLGRFYAIDPKAQFASPYLYAGNNPINMVDPDGELAFLAVVAIGAAIGATIGAIVGGIKAAQEDASTKATFGYIFGYAGIGTVAGAVAGGFAAGGAILGSSVGASLGGAGTAGGAASVGAASVGAASAGAASGALSSAASFLAAGATITGKASLAGAYVGGFIGSTAGGALAGTIEGAAQTSLNNTNKRDSDPRESIRDGARGGAILGSIFGAVSGALGGAAADDIIKGVSRLRAGTRQGIQANALQAARNASQRTNGSGISSIVRSLKNSSAAEFARANKARIFVRTVDRGMTFSGIFPIDFD
ncbi:RHS repeat-associated core domain protein [Xenococcus sp. PCC 7305]|uniref:RHS repeat domain-containing protein n=1 Tax=Xenococcus sp. PCC 7305 TaxID=102125 RepID=UPI0002AC4151|nr:RHS repeat-associated core domain-containing protein [Xenococcus sp. PCC 7305]ELS03519.1 RHS repeat-associated core domain protein [Xenococcus sp. PCC 7305]